MTGQLQNIGKDSPFPTLHHVWGILSKLSVLSAIAKLSTNLAQIYKFAIFVFFTAFPLQMLMGNAASDAIFDVHGTVFQSGSSIELLSE